MKPPKKRSRHGVRAEGKTATTISLSEELLEKARRAAKADGRSFSNWLEKQMKQALNDAGKAGLITLAACHITSGPLRRALVELNCGSGLLITGERGTGEA